MISWVSFVAINLFTDLLTNLRVTFIVARKQASLLMSALFIITDTFKQTPITPPVTPIIIVIPTHMLLINTHPLKTNPLNWKTYISTITNESSLELSRS